ncbi:hypothetical protein [Saccharopolyspora rectivirgula]|uniref:hypothetical protein n=1 Tax=Saccharopolyspora rectivirgula TaxID=28042 RepID=UPI001362A951|nr:hypothetical protein [Saccharopolyspora rectivirgula]
MSVRRYTLCAVAVTASAVAGLITGGFLAAERAELRPVDPVSQISSIITSDATR